MSSGSPRPTRDDFKIAILCATPVETSPVAAMFETDWEKGWKRYGRAKGDTNEYKVGSISQQNVVLAFASDVGKSNAASVAAGLSLTFKNIELLLVVGICGGVPNIQRPGQARSMFLGDVVISTQVVQYDLGAQYRDKFVPFNTLSRTRTLMRSFLARLHIPQEKMDLEADISMNLTTLFENPIFGKSDYPGMERDRLFYPSYQHMHRSSDCKICGNERNEICDEARKLLCDKLCDPMMQVSRDQLDQSMSAPDLVNQKAKRIGKPNIHLGWMASGDTLMKSALHREEVIDKITELHRHD